MKIEREKATNSKEFKPVTLTITIESKEELLNLYHRIYISDEHIKKLIKKNNSGFDSTYSFYYADDMEELWNELSGVISNKKDLGEITDVDEDDEEEDDDN